MRFWRHRRHRNLLKAALTDTPHRRSRIEKILWSIVESGVIYVVVWVRALDDTSLRHNLLFIRNSIYRCALTDTSTHVLGHTIIIFCSRHIPRRERRKFPPRFIDYLGPTSRRECPFVIIAYLSRIQSDVASVYFLTLQYLSLSMHREYTQLS